MISETSIRHIEEMPQQTFDEIVEKYVEVNIAHPFREGNDRSTRIWLNLILKKEIKQVVGWSRVDKDDYLMAMECSPIKDIEIKHILRNALTDKINDREMYMKGIDHSYYYEGYVTGKPPVPLQTKNKRKRGTSCENSSFFVFRISTRPASLLARLFHLGNPLFAFFRKLLRPWKQVLQKIQIRIVHVFRNLGQ